MPGLYELVFLRDGWTESVTLSFGDELRFDTAIPFERCRDVECLVEVLCLALRTRFDFTLGALLVASEVLLERARLVACL